MNRSGAKPREFEQKIYLYISWKISVLFPAVASRGFASHVFLVLFNRQGYHFYEGRKQVIGPCRYSKNDWHMLMRDFKDD